MAVSAHLDNVQPTTKITNVKCPHGQIIRYTMEGGLDFPMLTITARQAHIFPNIKHSLVSLGEICDAGCIVVFGIKDVTVM